jgi:hypothetical protein
MRLHEFNLGVPSSSRPFSAQRSRGDRPQATRRVVAGVSCTTISRVLRYIGARPGSGEADLSLRGVRGAGP